MKKLIFISAILLFSLIFLGCVQQKVEVEMSTAHWTDEGQKPATETFSVNLFEEFGRAHQFIPARKLFKVLTVKEDKFLVQYDRQLVIQGQSIVVESSPNPVWVKKGEEQCFDTRTTGEGATLCLLFS